MKIIRKRKIRKNISSKCSSIVSNSHHSTNSSLLLRKQLRYPKSILITKQKIKNPEIFINQNPNPNHCKEGKAVIFSSFRTRQPSGINTHPAERRTVEKVSLIIKNRSGYVTDNEIHIWADRIKSYSGDVKREFAGTVYHGLTHIWQWNGNEQAPGGLIEGIADFVRLKANYAASNWVQPGQGDRWGKGYSVTAWFLDYCNSLRDGFVAELNKKMRSGYSPDFFVELLGMTVDQLWTGYKAKSKSYSTTCENQIIWIFY